MEEEAPAEEAPAEEAPAEEAPTPKKPPPKKLKTLLTTKLQKNKFGKESVSMASAAEQLAANLSFSAFRTADELKKRIWFTLGALLVYRLGTYIPLTRY